MIWKLILTCDKSLIYPLIILQGKTFFSLWYTVNIRVLTGRLWQNSSKVWSLALLKIRNMLELIYHLPKSLNLNSISAIPVLPVIFFSLCAFEEITFMSLLMMLITLYDNYCHDMCTNIHGDQKMSSSDFNGPFIFHLALTTLQTVLISCEVCISTFDSFIQTFMVYRGWTLMMLVIPWLFLRVQPSDSYFFV